MGTVMYSLVWILVHSILYVNTLPQYKHPGYALVKSPKVCIPPYELIGQQCLFFSRPYEPWGITQSWDQAYKNFYDASIFCLSRGGFLAEHIQSVEKAQRFCKYLKGSCYQWSPVTGQETRVPCNTMDLKARFVCQQE